MDPLTAETEALNADLVACEKSLTDLGLGATAEVPLPNGGYLGFGKLDHVWRLYYVNLPNVGATLISHTSRAVRVEITNHLPALHQAILDAVVKNQREVEAARERVANFLGFLHREKEKKP